MNETDDAEINRTLTFSEVTVRHILKFNSLGKREFITVVDRAEKFKKIEHLFRHRKIYSAI